MNMKYAAADLGFSDRGAMLPFLYLFFPLGWYTAIAVYGLQYSRPIVQCSDMTVNSDA